MQRAEPGSNGSGRGSGRNRPSGRQVKPQPFACHELRSAGGFLPPGPLPSEPGLVKSVPEELETTTEVVVEQESTNRADETDLPEVFSKLAERLLQCMEPADCSGLAAGLLSRGKLKEEDLQLAPPAFRPWPAPPDLSLQQLLAMTAPRHGNLPEQRAGATVGVPAVPMKPNLSLVELLQGEAQRLGNPRPAAPTSNRMMPAVPEAELRSFGPPAFPLGPTPMRDEPVWVPLSSLEGDIMQCKVTQDSGERNPRFKDTNDSWVSHVSTLEPCPGASGRGSSEATRSEGSVIGSGEIRSSLASLDDEDLTSRLDRDGMSHYSSVFLRNLPFDYGQQRTIELMESKGFRDYDLVLWFPSKKDSSRKTSSCFINFSCCDSAQNFAQEFHRWKPEGVEYKLNVSPARLQGFTENFVKYWHLSKEHGENQSSVCSPFFAKDQLSKVSFETWERAKKVKEEMKKVCNQGVIASEWTATTLVIRNLPKEIENQEQAMEWLDHLGYRRHHYDFLLYIPRKSSRKATKQKSLAYIFVNFKDSMVAKVCQDTLPQIVTDGMPLSVVPSRIQGKETCMEHFREVEESGRLVPFIGETSMEEPCTTNGPRLFQ